VVVVVFVGGGGGGGSGSGRGGSGGGSGGSSGGGSGGGSGSGVPTQIVAVMEAQVVLDPSPSEGSSPGTMRGKHTTAPLPSEDHSTTCHPQSQS
jgi:hypothetical protein